jgi:hypothetical protein
VPGQEVVDRYRWNLVFKMCQRHGCKETIADVGWTLPVKILHERGNCKRDKPPGEMFRTRTNLLLTQSLRDRDGDAMEEVRLLHLHLLSWEATPPARSTKFTFALLRIIASTPSHDLSNGHGRKPWNRGLRFVPPVNFLYTDITHHYCTSPKLNLTSSATHLV